MSTAVDRARRRGPPTTPSGCARPAADYRRAERAAAGRAAAVPDDLRPYAAARPVAEFDLEGAGVVSSWAELAAALTAEQVDPHQVGFAAAGAGLDTLGAVLHPFDALLQAGLGWLVEHVAFLREPLDALAGDPDAVLAQARHWDRVAARAAGGGGGATGRRRTRLGAARRPRATGRRPTS